MSIIVDKTIFVNNKLVDKQHYLMYILFISGKWVKVLVAGKNVSGTPGSMKETLKKATTEMLVLFLLRQKSMYTYEMMTTIERISGGRITFNTLYQAIYRLRGFGYIAESDKVLSEENRIRIYFSITPSGQTYLSELMEEYRATTDVIDQILSMDGRVVQEAEHDG